MEGLGLALGLIMTSDDFMSLTWAEQSDPNRLLQFTGCFASCCSSQRRFNLAYFICVYFICVHLIRVFSKTPDEEDYIKEVQVNRYGVIRAPHWSQAWGWGSQASAWWLGLCPADPAGCSQTQTYCEGLLGTSGGTLCKGGLQLPPPGELDQIQREAGDIESKWTMLCSPLPLLTQLSRAVAIRSPVPVVAAIPEPGGGHRKQGMLSS